MPHLNCRLSLLALPKESLGYTTLMGAPPKVQPVFFAQFKKSLGYTILLKCSLCLLAQPKESLRYTILMGAPPKVQPVFVSST